MDGDRIARATSRIEAALERIEAGARHIAARGADQSDDTDLTALQARHDRLRAVVQQSLDQLDLLIESAER